MAKKVKTISLDGIQEILTGMQDDVESFNNGTKAPGSRIRKGLQEIKVACMQMRKDVTEIRNSR